MKLFSSKARRLLDRAVALLPDQHQQESWRAWSIAHPGTRHAGEPLEEGRGRIPRDVAAIGLAALELMVSDLKRTRDSENLADDELAFVENDLTFIDTVESLLIMDLRESCTGRVAA